MAVPYFRQCFALLTRNLAKMQTGTMASSDGYSLFTVTVWCASSLIKLVFSYYVIFLRTKQLKS